VLGRLAHKYLCGQASSVLCERVFFTAGNIVTKKRSRLCGEFVETLILVH
jgi:hypothetical protein